ncbi:MAG TPA: hypothetical protein VLG46_11295, partial [Anaerolineae bacterium]|nr:hypothetical protein [Anaerolineae bacterium]
VIASPAEKQSHFIEHKFVSRSALAMTYHRSFSLTIKTLIKKSEYHDSVTLMLVAQNDYVVPHTLGL